MTKQQAADASQLVLFADEVNRELSKKPGQLIPLRLTAEDIGGTLIAILSKGLYTNPLDCIREYVQNSVDAEAREVTIKVTANSVSIFDMGTGMNLQDFLLARQFGLSPKSLSESVGFRGIGIYSAFDLCKRLRITSSKEGDPYRHVLVFEFADMKAALEADRRRGPDDPRISLSTLLSKCTRIKREGGTEPLQQHFTHVELQDISDVHIRQLADRVAMKRYLLQNLPIDFDDDFEYKEIVNRELDINLGGYRPVKITLQSDGLPDEVVARPSVSGLQSPKFGFIESAGQKVAFYWACLNRERGRISSQSQADRQNNLPDFAGFTYKMKGFTIGDRNKLLSKFVRKPQLYRWYTGEIYVLDENVIPNAARDDFETSPASRALDFAVGAQLKKLEDDVEAFQAQGVAHERIDQYKEEIVELENQITLNVLSDNYASYSRLDDILRDLKRQRIKATQEQRAIADEIMNKAQRLQRQLTKEVASPTPESKRRRRAAQKQQPGGETNVLVIEPLPPQPLKTLLSVLADIGLETEGQMGLIIVTLQETLSDVLGSGSDLYRSFLNDFEARLLSSLNED